jgi:hypothetical protein
LAHLYFESVTFSNLIWYPIARPSLSKAKQAIPTPLAAIFPPITPGKLGGILGGTSSLGYTLKNKPVSI